MPTWSGAAPTPPWRSRTPVFSARFYSARFWPCGCTRDWLKVTFVFMARHQHLRQFRTALGNPYILFRTVIADAIRRGEIPRQDPELAAALVVGAFTTVFDAKILGRLKGDLATLARPTAAACLRMLRA